MVGRSEGTRGVPWYLRRFATPGRSGPNMLDGRWRAKAERALDPIGRSLHRLGISANGLTVLGLVIADATAVAIGSGHLTLAFFGVVLTGGADLLDGSVARHTGKAGPPGTLFGPVP